MNILRDFPRSPRTDVPPINHDKLTILYLQFAIIGTSKRDGQVNFEIWEHIKKPVYDTKEMQFDNHIE
jgi:hypothetical protein